MMRLDLDVAERFSLLTGSRWDSRHVRSSAQMSAPARTIRAAGAIDDAITFLQTRGSHSTCSGRSIGVLILADTAPTVCKENGGTQT